MSLSARFDQLQKRSQQRKQQDDTRAAVERDPEFVMTYDDSYLATQYGNDEPQQNGNGRRVSEHDDHDDGEALPRGGRRRRAPPGRDRDTYRRAGGRDRSRSPQQRRGRIEDEDDFEPRTRRGNEPYRPLHSRRGQSNGSARRRNPVVVTKAPSSYQPVVMPAGPVGILPHQLLTTAVAPMGALTGRFDPYAPQVVTHVVRNNGARARANNTGYSRNTQSSTRGRRGNSRGGRGSIRGGRGRSRGGAPRGTQGRGVGVAVGRGRGNRGRGARGGRGGRGGRGSTRGRGGRGGRSNASKQSPKSKEALDAELDKFMGKSKDELTKEKRATDASKLDDDLDSYWKKGESN